ncbi:hypothetical protein J1605_021014 [Eschrichtius robustus]|uniref:Uncharacterized protein n=1 Tax=Eschrichtius robustus TaxID=9764 RepID=A0AB34HJF1_ESCRO|nr:hypothetical protein J1605_021014 [Eschrichtius robustus]
MAPPITLRRRLKAPPLQTASAARTRYPGWSCGFARSGECGAPRGREDTFLVFPQPSRCPRGSRGAELEQRPGPVCGGRLPPAPPPETAVVEAAGEAQAESGGL